MQLNPEIEKIERHIRSAQKQRAEIDAAPKASIFDHAHAFIARTPVKGAITAADVSKAEADRRNLDATIAGLIEMRIELELKLIADEMRQHEAEAAAIRAEIEKYNPRPREIQVEIARLEDELARVPSVIEHRYTRLHEANKRILAARVILKDYKHVLSDDTNRQLGVHLDLDMPRGQYGLVDVPFSYNRRLFELRDRLVAPEGETHE